MTTYNITRTNSHGTHVNITTNQGRERQLVITPKGTVLAYKSNNPLDEVKITKELASVAREVFNKYYGE